MPWAPNYATAQELRDYSRVPDALDDTYLGLAVSAASRAVDHAAGRQFGNVSAELRRYTARPDYVTGYWTADVDDFHTSVGLSVSLNVAPFTGISTFDKAPLNAAQMGRPWTRIEFRAESELSPADLPAHDILVTAAWGWAAIPDTVKEATLLQGERFATRRQAPFGIAGSVDQGSEMRLLAKADPDVFVMLANYRRVRSPA